MGARQETPQPGAGWDTEKESKDGHCEESPRIYLLG